MGMDDCDEPTFLPIFEFKYLYWALMVHLFNPMDIYDSMSFGYVHSLTSIRIMPGINLATMAREEVHLKTASVKAGLVGRVKALPFEGNMLPFVAIAGEGDVINYAQVLLFFQCRNGGKVHNLAYIKYLSDAILGARRALMPLPSTFPIHQWAMNAMGCRGKPRGRKKIPPPPKYDFHFAVIDIDSILNLEHVVEIGNGLLVNNVHAWYKMKQLLPSY